MKMIISKLLLEKDQFRIFTRLKLKANSNGEHPRTCEIKIIVRRIEHRQRASEDPRHQHQRS